MPTSRRARVATVARECVAFALAPILQLAPLARAGLSLLPVPTNNLIRVFRLDRLMDRATIRRRCSIS